MSDISSEPSKKEFTTTSVATTPKVQLVHNSETFDTTEVSLNEASDFFTKKSVTTETTENFQGTQTPAYETTDTTSIQWPSVEITVPDDISSKVRSEDNVLFDAYIPPTASFEDNKLHSYSEYDIDQLFEAVDAVTRTTDQSSEASMDDFELQESANIESAHKTIDDAEDEYTDSAANISGVNEYSITDSSYGVFGVDPNYYVESDELTRVEFQSDLSNSVLELVISETDNPRETTLSSFKMIISQKLALETETNDSQLEQNHLNDLVEEIEMISLFLLENPSESAKPEQKEMIKLCEQRLREAIESLCVGLNLPNDNKTIHEIIEQLMTFQNQGDEVLEYIDLTILGTREAKKIDYDGATSSDFRKIMELLVGRYALQFNLLNFN